MYDFDTIMDHRGTGSLKWDTVKEGVIPLWVADMDFPCLPELREALRKRADHPFYGYQAGGDSYYEAIRSWYGERHGLELDRTHILAGPGTVLSLGIAVREFSREGEGVLLLTPVYTPFFEVVRENRRRVVDVPLAADPAGRFILDIDNIEEALDRAGAEGIRTPLALFCSPHNPGGRVWTGEEIAAFLDLVRRRNMFAAVDEIHGDFVYPENAAGKPQRFVSAASLPEFQDRTLVISGANKSFNLGGLHISHFVIKDGAPRRIIQAALHREAHHQGDVFAELAVETVYRRGAAWLDEVLDYLRENIRRALERLNGIPGIRAFTPDGTYLIWADVRGLAERRGCQNTAELVRRLEDEAAVKITAGSIYGPPGEGRARINAAAPRKLLLEGLRRLEAWA
ncbi:MAG: aminotransferase class I/II-fold pyridoxal phosphate-dependent enzyme [Treponema sp.]|jgi:cystathionine beta-lyase|nr:aminotransferase class I/II-fold pyridoxal phosphate-dependent enzyme [Treponema sp.]